MKRIEKFYSLREWTEYARHFMPNAAIMVSDKTTKIKTHKNKTLGTWFPAGHGAITERRSRLRLSREQECYG